MVDRYCLANDCQHRGPILGKLYGLTGIVRQVQGHLVADNYLAVGFFKSKSECVYDPLERYKMDSSYPAHPLWPQYFILKVDNRLHRIVPHHTFIHFKTPVLSRCSKT